MSQPRDGITVRAAAHDTLDALAWRRLGATAGHVEATLAANPGLARSAADLAEGQAVRLVQAPEPARALVKLWD
ncbi:tail protein X [Acidovorax phage Acica]|nr:tail protein X [Acidovorax phage Acica]